MPSVLLASCAPALGKDEDEPLLLAALGEAGVTAGVADWADPSVVWSGADAVVVRSTWDYAKEPDAFLAILRQIACAGARLFNPLDMVFIGAQRRLQGYSDATVDKLRALLRVMTVPAKGVVVFSGDGEPVASGLMAIADGIVITGNVVTLPGHRRQGYAAAMMRTGLSWAREAGATIAALNVAAENTPARALYAGLGYRRQYDYRYRVPARR